MLAVHPLALRKLQFHHRLRVSTALVPIMEESGHKGLTFKTINKSWRDNSLGASIINLDLSEGHSIAVSAIYFDYFSRKRLHHLPTLFSGGGAMTD